MDQLIHREMFKRGCIVVGVAVRAQVWIAGIILWLAGYESVYWPFDSKVRLLTWGPFLERPGNFSDPKGNFEIKTCYTVAQFLAHKPVSFASFTYSCIVLISKLLKLRSWTQTQQTQNNFSRPKSYRDFRETGPCTDSKQGLWLAGKTIGMVT